VDGIDLLILALRLLFVALLYAFLVVVLRTSIGAVGSPSADRAPHERRRLEFVVIEPGTSSLAAGEVIGVPDGATFGRAGEADIVLADSAVSAQHARIQRVGRKWVITDLGSTNGTRVNDAIAHPRATLAEGDVVQLGTVQLQVRPRDGR
jgi:hypothetical protein